MHDPEKGSGRNATGEAGDLIGLQIDDHGVPKAFCHEGDAVVVRGEVGAFAKGGKDGDVGRQVIQGVADHSLMRLFGLAGQAAGGG